MEGCALKGPIHGRRLSLGSFGYTHTSSSLSPSSSSSSSSSSSWDSSSPHSSETWAWSPMVARAAVPFSWEAKPGVPKQKHRQKQQTQKQKQKQLQMLKELVPPPNAQASSSFGGSSRRGSGGSAGKKTKENDPFLMALMECTKSQQSASDRSDKSVCSSKSTRVRSAASPLNGISCMRSCSVADTHVPVSRMPLLQPPKHPLISFSSSSF